MQAIVQEGELGVDSSPLAMYNFFVERIRQNLHIVLTMSPIGDAFRDRLRKFPSLINCCTIDWFQVSFFYAYLYLIPLKMAYVKKIADNYLAIGPSFNKANPTATLTPSFSIRTQGMARGCVRNGCKQVFRRRGNVI